MLKTAEDLIKFKYPDKLVLLNGRYPRPLIFYKGFDLVERAISEPGSVTNSNLLNLLKDYRILIDASVPEPKPRIVQKFDSSGKRELSVYLLVTQKCNLNCTYCLGANESYINFESMSFEVAKEAIDKAVTSMLPNSQVNIVYFGGEPILNWELVKKVLHYVNDDIVNTNGIRFKHNITTNLTYLPEDFTEYANKYDISVLVDIDGNCATHNKMRPFRGGKPSYDKIVANLRVLKASGIHFEIRSTVASENVNLLDEISKHHKGLETDVCAFPTITPVDSEGSVLSSKLYPDPSVYKEKLSKVIKNGEFTLSNICPSNVFVNRMLRGEFVKFDCGMILGNTVAVTHEGNVYPCIYFVGQDEFFMGNVGDKINPIDQVSCERLYNKYADILDVDNIEECRKCQIRYICGGGCSVRLLSLRKDDEETRRARKYFYDITCAGSWATVEAMVEYFEKGYAKQLNDAPAV